MSVMYFDSVPLLAGTLEYPALRGRFAVGNLVSLVRQTRPDDPIGTTTVTFSGVNAGSEIRVYLPDGSVADGIETCSDNQALAWSVYAPGSTNNTVTVRIVNMAYKIKEFSFTSTVGTVSLPIQQEPDPWYSNPA